MTMSITWRFDDSSCFEERSRAELNDEVRLGCISLQKYPCVELDDDISTRRLPCRQPPPNGIRPIPCHDHHRHHHSRRRAVPREHLQAFQLMVEEEEEEDNDEEANGGGNEPQPQELRTAVNV
ncbi:hypothetical protein BHM03_00060783 [Ensete ventricosum]|nr:hypothetical protein BHM03_00060783 [Ensete ventricosum]